MSSATEALANSALFEGIPEDMLADVGRLMTPRVFDPGETVFAQGDQGQSLMVLESGAFVAYLAKPGGGQDKLSDVKPGDVIGELSLLGEGGRTATIVATDRSMAWELERSAFDVLRHDTRHSAAEMVRRIGMQAIGRLRNFYGRVAPTIEGEPRESTAETVIIRREPPEPFDYLSTLLFFKNFTATEVAKFTAPLKQLYVQRDSVIVKAGEAPEALYLVVRGAVETSMRGETSTRRLRLAGPGRLIGHTRVMKDHEATARVESRARENSVLIEIPWEEAERLLMSDDRIARRFSDALWTDAVRAVQYGEHPIPNTKA